MADLGAGPPYPGDDDARTAGVTPGPAEGDARPDAGEALPEVNGVRPDAGATLPAAGGALPGTGDRPRPEADPADTPADKPGDVPADVPADASADPPSPADPLARLVGALHGAGLGPDTSELADALWLARWCRPTWMPGAEEAGEDADRPAAGGTDYPRAHRPDGTDGAGTRLVPPPRELPDDRKLSLYPGEGGPGQPVAGGGTSRTGAIGVAVPEAAALPRLLEIQAALRPLQRFRTPAPPLRTELDEPATAEHSALAGGLLLPVFRPVRRGEAAMQLLMDASSSMYVWERMLRELAGVFGRLGAFREVQVRYVHSTPEGGLAASGRFDPGPSGLRPVEQLGDPTGRRVTLMVSDCAGPLWRSGQAHRLLHRLARHGPVAVLQPLPTRLWSRTLLPVSYGVLHRAEGMLQAAPPRFTPGATGAPPAPGALPVPVLPPTAPALGAWARLLSGTGTAGVPASVGWVRADHPATRVPRQRGTVPAPALVARFRATASPDAVQLAVYLAAAPLYLPVMQLVQRTMLPDSGPAELAEVLLSGLVVRRPGEDHRWYHFAPGVRDVLLGPLGRDEALLVLKHCSEYVEQRFGRSGPNFPALAITQLTEGPGDPLADAAVRSAVKEAARSAVRREGRAEEGVAAEFRQPFAEVAARVLERFMPLPENGAARRLAPVAHVSTVVGRARELADRFAREGMVQNLLDAVAMLRRAAGQERVRGRDPELWSELAQQLVTLWRVRGGATLLREAQEAADTAAAHHTLPARAVRARVLQAAAEDRAQVGDDRAALELLRRADREFTAVCAAPGQASEEVLGFTLERISVLERQWEISGDTGLLQETVGMLEAFADSWPPQRSRPSQLPMAHGRALLRLSGTARTRERERVYAEQAVNSFAAGLDALEREEGPPEAVVEAMLCVVDAQLRAGGRLEEAQRLVDRALGETRDRLLRATILARAGRIRAARYEESGAAGELEAAAGRFAEACRLTPRDRPEYRDLVAEWGQVLLSRSALPDGELFVNRAVLVLRDCRMETPESDPRLPDRLLMLGSALVLRYRAEEDRVDLREAEYMLGLAAQAARAPELLARTWFELGQVHRLWPAHDRRPERLDQAADAYRRAAGAAVGAAQAAAEPEPMRRLAARSHHWRGDAYETARRPRAAVEAYRAALAEWQRVPGGGGEEAAETVQRLAHLSGD